MKKLLYSPGFGAGWTTWSSGDVVGFMVGYKPIIDFLEAGGKFTRDECHLEYEGDEPVLTSLHPVLRTFAEECKAQFDDIPYLGGATCLRVLEVEDEVQVSFDEYDGNESPRWRDSGTWY